jgi:hypothetical protein
MPPPPKNDYERELIQTIKGFGWQVTQVFDKNGVKPEFAYSIGIYETLKRPELIIIGLPRKNAGGIINLYGRRIRDERRVYRGGEFVDDLIEGYQAFLIDVTCSPSKEDYALSAGWYYDRGDFPMFQLVWPSIEKRYPWEHGQESLRREQPLLSPPIFLQ